MTRRPQQRRASHRTKETHTFRHYRFAVIFLISLLALALASCSDSDDDVEESATSTPTSTDVSPSPSTSPSASASAEPTASPAVETYVDPRFGYSVALPTGWRPATTFMDTFGRTSAGQQAGVTAEDYLVLTNEDVDAELQFAEPEAFWEFFRLSTVLVFPTKLDLDFQLTSHEGVGFSFVVSDVSTVALDNGVTATRFKVDDSKDEDHYLYDRLFVGGEVNGCPSCTGFIFQTTIAGRPLSEPPGPVDPPPAAYPVRDFESIFRSFEAAVPLTP